MGELQPVKSALRMAAVFSRHRDVLAEVAQLHVDSGLDVVHSSEPFAFVQTDYYQRDMGQDLWKQFHLIGGFCDPAELPDWKHQSNTWERSIAERGEYPESRPVNVDPGYITEAKLVLATTKDRDHRIYLRDAIYAEVTLYYHAGRWHTRPWTYPDYALESTIAFVDEGRRQLRNLIKMEG